jgi:hypothetical protein
MEGIAIGWSLTGTMNSSRSANLAMLYSNDGVNGTSSPCESSQTLSQPPAFRVTSSSQNVPANVDATRISEADLLLNLHSPYPAPIPRIPGHPTPSGTAPNTEFIHNSSLNNPFGQFQGLAVMPYSGMMIESQDIDMSMLAEDMMWLEYLPQDVKRGFGGPSAHS